ncbi:MAG TPA: hypothetical protein VLH40_00625 [Atribacteraceae bacterium]|nr:hypothetical protein [Atribacteraceae bacterium]
MGKYPRIYLSLDNCFAVKRWISPAEWMRIAEQIGCGYIEVSTDTECDPFYGNQSYLDDWLESVHVAQAQHNVTIANFFTGYSTYRTAGLLHPDDRIRDRLVNDWFKVMIGLAARLEAGLGFYIQAFPNSVLQDPEEYQLFKQRLFETIAGLVRYGALAGSGYLMLEQMYSPHQYPWTIETGKEYLREVYRLSGEPSYLALDSGHATGQVRFLRPTKERIERSIEEMKNNDRPTPVWWGAETTRRLFRDFRAPSSAAWGELLRAVESEMDRFPYLFSEQKDCDLYQWLRELGCYAPVIHLQQTNGQSSSHLPFTRENNRNGIVHPKKILEALRQAYQGPEDPLLPPRCGKIFLTLEIFFGAADYPDQIVDRLKESVEFWRQYLPEDGLSLDKLV